MLEQNPDYCDRNVIKEFESTAIAFFRDVLGMPPDTCLFISDESELNDFASAGLPDHAPPSISWDQWVIDQTEKLYGLTLSNTSIYLVSLFHEIELTKRAVRH